MVQRYVATEDRQFKQLNNGPFVLYSDHAALEKRCKELEESCEDWRKNCLAYIEGLNMTEKRLEELEAENAELRKKINLK